MSINSEIEIESHESIQARMAEQVSFLDTNNSNLGKSGLATLRDDIPPPEGQDAVITPKEYQQNIAQGLIPADSRLFVKASDAILEYCGPGQKVNLNQDWCANTQLDQGASEQNLAALFNHNPTGLG